MKIGSIDILLFDKEPMLFCISVPGSDQGKMALDFLSVQNQFKVSLDQLFVGGQVQFRTIDLEGTGVPNDHFASAIVSFRYGTVKMQVFDRMVFGAHRQPLIARVHRRSFWHRPTF